MTFDTVPSLAVDLLALVLGFTVGSFLNVLALRSLSEESLLWPPSKCPRCQHPLSPLDNIPLLSYLLLRGKCRYCQGEISWQYPAVEAFTGLTFVAIERSVFDPSHSIFNSQYWNTLLFSFLSDDRKAALTSHLQTGMGSLEEAINHALSNPEIMIAPWQQIGLLIGMVLFA
jgi:prepilin signal peptidase PulO-like enzyme (type II secretory pathway)